MLAKKFRLPVKTTKERLGISFKSPHFLFIKKKNNLQFSRFGVVIGKKNSHLATVRNKIKRVIFNTIRLLNFHKIKGNDVLIIVLSTFKIEKNNFNVDEIKKEIQRSLNNLLN
jgi:ribonuclease P protein component